MTQRSLRFESFVLDLKRLSLHGPSGQVDLRPKSFEVLRYLVEHAGRVVTKEEVLNAIWPDVTVTDESLTQCIRDVRRALGDESQRIVKTVPRRGYLVDMPISAAASPFSEAIKAAAVGEAMPLVLPDRPSIAVLAFTNMSGDPSQDYFSDGTTEDIITELSRFSELLVIARNSSFRYKGQSVDVRQIGRELCVRYVLEGSIRRAGDRIRISAQLVDTVTGVHRWAERYDRKLEDVFAVQDEVARTIVAVLAVHVNKAETERVLAKPPADWQAYDYYLRATNILAFYHSSYSKDDLLHGRRLLRQVLAIDPDYARAHAALSGTYVSLWRHRWDDDCPWPAALDRAYQSGLDAVRLAPDLPEAHVALGFSLNFMCHHEAAIAEFERATLLNPNLTNFRFALALVFAGEPARAIQSVEAHMKLDPFYSPYAPAVLGSAYYLLKRYAEAVPRLREAVSRAPNLAHSRFWSAAAHAQLGQLDRAKIEVVETLRIEPWFAISQVNFVRLCKHPEHAEHLKDGLRKAGFPE